MTARRTSPPAPPGPGLSPHGGDPHDRRVGRVVAEAAEEVLRIDPNFSLDYHKNILPYKNQETLNKYIDALRNAGLPD